MEPSSIWLLGWRVLCGLAFAVAPWAFPPDLPNPATLDGILLRTVIGAATLALLVVRLGRALRAPGPRHWGLVCAALTGAAAVAAAAALPTPTIPLGASCWLLGPLAWASLAGLAADRVPAPRRRAALAVIAALGVASYAVALPRVQIGRAHV